MEYQAPAVGHRIDDCRAVDLACSGTGCRTPRHARQAARVAMQFRLRTLLIVLAIGPPSLALAWVWGVPVFVFLIWPKTPNEDVISAFVKSALCAIAAIMILTVRSFYLRP